MALPIPPGSGVVRSPASALMPKPTISARISAPRADACFDASSTNMAAPSPSTIPFLSLENGRQASGARIRIASHPFNVPGVMQASVPPVIAQVTVPDRIIWKA